MSKTGRRTDENHKQIVDGLREMGATVQSLADVGRGCPDLLVGWRGLNLIFEVKDGAKFPSQRKLTLAEETWHESWRGQVSIVASLEDALQAIGATSQD